MNTKSKLFSFILILFLGVFAVVFTLKIEKDKKNEAAAQRIAAEQLAQKKARDAEEKIYLMGKFDPAQRNDFAAVPKEDSASWYQMYLRKETLNAFFEMEKAADKDDIDLKIASATRNFDYQKGIWNDKWTGKMLVKNQNLAKIIPDGLTRFKKILEYSAVPGTSRHHWGTDIDINAATPEYFQTEEGREVYYWLAKNASSFGFCQPYTLKGSARPTGYNEEKWHWSYLPIAKKLTEEYSSLITENDINGFLGDEYVAGQDLINDYVLAINPECL